MGLNNVEATNVTIGPFWVLFAGVSCARASPVFDETNESTRDALKGVSGTVCNSSGGVVGYVVMPHQGWLCPTLRVRNLFDRKTGFVQQTRVSTMFRPLGLWALIR